MSNRRTFLQQTAALSALAAWGVPQHLFAKPMKKVGIQLFSLPKSLEKDFKGTMALLAQMGYKEIELFGPYPFSAESTQKSWKAMSGFLGFSGSGYFGLTPQEVKATLKANGLTTPSAHTDLETLLNHMPQLGEAGDQLGFEYVVLPAIPDDRRKTLDDYKKMAEVFNQIGESAKRVGLKFAYHNHGYGIKEKDGQVPLRVLLDATDPSLVFLEMDIFWTIAGGANPQDLLAAYPKRYHLMHLKDMRERKQFSGDGGNAQQWMELFPLMTSAGSGVLDLPAIVQKGQEAGVKHFFVEQDLVADPDVALKKSLDYLKKLS